MLSDNTTSDIIDLLGQRTRFLECLQETPKDKRTLVEDLDCSRSTIDRGVRELESLGLLRYDTTGYDSTVCGQLAAKEYRQFERRIETLFELQPFFEWISPNTFELELEWLTDAELLLPEPSNPYSMINRHVQLLKETGIGQFTLPYIGLHAAEAAHEGIVQKGAEHELVVVPTVAETLQTSPAFAELIKEMAATGRLDVFVYEGSFPYGVAIYDDEVVQIIVDENEEPRAVLETDRAEVREWAQRKIDEYKQQSTKLSFSQRTTKA